MRGIVVGTVLSLLILLPLLINPFWQHLLAEIFTWGLLALAFDLLYGYGGLLSLGQSVFFGVGAYAGALAILRLGLGLWLALMLGLAAALLLAALLGPLLARGSGHGFIILTMVLAIIFYLLALKLRGLTGGDDGLTIVAPLIFKGISLADSTVNYYFALAILAAALGIAWWLVRTPLGWAFVLVRENERRAAALGYDIRMVKLVAIIISGGLSGLAGGLYLLTARFASADLFHWTVAANPLVWTLLGGAGSLFGPLLGTAVLLLAQEWLSSWWSHGYPILVGILIILAVRLAPQGLWGLILRWRSLR
jgi:branched-chain amino acid transport system permease protein